MSDEFFPYPFILNLPYDQLKTLFELCMRPSDSNADSTYPNPYFIMVVDDDRVPHIRPGFLSQAQELARVWWRAEIQRAPRGRPPGLVRFANREDFRHVILRIMCDELRDRGTITQDAISLRFGLSPKGERLLSEGEIRRYCVEFESPWREMKAEAITQDCLKPR